MENSLGQELEQLRREKAEWQIQKEQVRHVLYVLLALAILVLVGLIAVAALLLIK